MQDIKLPIDLSKLVIVGEKHAENAILEDDAVLKQVAGAVKAHKTAIGRAISTLQADLTMYMVNNAMPEEIVSYRFALAQLEVLWERLLAYEVEDEKRDASKKATADEPRTEES